MKINVASLLGLIAGSLSTLLLVFLLKPTFLNHQPAQSNNEVADNPTEDYQDSIEVPECDPSCVEKIIANMLSGDNLDNEYGMNIKDIEAIKTADYLSKNPQLISEIQGTLVSQNDQDKRDTILYTFSLLPEEQFNQVTETLLASENKRDRFDGISLLYSAANERNLNVDDALKEVVKNDNNNDVALHAISAIYSINPESIGQTTNDRLSIMISSAENDAHKSEALLAKSRILEVDEQLKSDIEMALTSSSEPFKQAGIQALDGILGRQGSGVAAGNWVEDSSVKILIENIGNDQSAHPFTRVEALNLLRRNYY